MTRRTTVKNAFLGAVSVALASQSARAAFPAPIQANPASQAVASFGVDYQHVLTYSEPLGLDSSFNRQPDLYWFKYTSNGRTLLKLDTLGSNFGIGGGGLGLPSTNESQIAVYTPAGQKVAISKNTVDLNGNPIPAYPTYTSDSSQWYYPEELSELYFQANPGHNPHWDADPNDPTPYTGWAAPGNEGNSQRYYRPYYYTDLNEYHVWSTALSTKVLNNNGEYVDHDGNVVTDPNLAQDQPGWRYFDRSRIGPAATWNRYQQLPKGDYYIAISSISPVFQGDQYSEEVLRAPIFYDYVDMVNKVPKLNGPLGTFQYYNDQGDAAANTRVFSGTIQLNATQTPLPANLVWVGDQASAAWDVETTNNWLNGAASDQFYTNDNVLFDDSSTHTTVNLTATQIILPTSITINASQNYTFSGAGSISGATTLTKSGLGKLTIANTGANDYTGTTAVSGGTLELAAASRLGSGTISVGTAGFVTVASGRTAAVKAGALILTSPGTMDLNDNDLIVGNATPKSTIEDYVKTARNNGAWNAAGLTSTAARSATATGLGVISGAEYTSMGGSGVFSAQSYLATDTLVKYTWNGDANFSGTVNFDDYVRTDIGFNTHLTGWSNGDFNYSGGVNFDDYVLIDIAFNTQSGTLGRAVDYLSGDDRSADRTTDPAVQKVLEHFAQFGTDYATHFLAAVPEPGALVLLGAPAFVGMSGRKRRDAR